MQGPDQPGKPGPGWEPAGGGSRTSSQIFGPGTNTTTINSY